MAQGEPIVPALGNRSLAYRMLKRVADIVGALAVLLLLLPLLLLLVTVLCCTTRGRPLFIQNRVGYRGRVFRMLKFRTMRLDAERVLAKIHNEQEGPVFKNRRDPRVTRIGRVLRKTSMDELPQLLNVLAGK